MSALLSATMVGDPMPVFIATYPDRGSSYIKPAEEGLFLSLRNSENGICKPKSEWMRVGSGIVCCRVPTVTLFKAD